eukprot:TRINITY_DN5537_c0_g1_i1.p2 TRINITY_DN5537_c0_g1~~TRINITY_DN5537_c0_g1_i1.p2  ORF type:complete len:115 (+),score=37.28 TRINITY_DN5537_c0_g1_i1:1-345(+)
MYDRILLAPLRFPVPVPQAAAALVGALLTRAKPHRLATAAEARAHAFFSEIDFDALTSRDLTPPFVPDLLDDDTKYFDEQFTAEPAVLSVCLAPPAQDNLRFQGFSYEGSRVSL